MIASSLSAGQRRLPTKQAITRSHDNVIAAQVLQRLRITQQLNYSVLLEEAKWLADM